MFRFDDAAKSRVSVHHAHGAWQITIARRANRSKFAVAMPPAMFALIAYLALRDSPTWNMAFRTLFLLTIPGVVCIGLFLQFLRTNFEEDAITISATTLTLQRTFLSWKSEKTVLLSNVRGVRMNTGRRFGLIPDLLLDCGRRTYAFGAYLNEEDAKRVISAVHRYAGAVSSTS